MYQKFKILILSVFMLMIFSQQSYSVCNNCTFRVGWETRHNVISVSGCPVSFDYRFAICEGSGDVKIELLGISIPSSCTGATQEQFTEQVSRYLLSATHIYLGYFSPAPSNFNVSLTVPQCFEMNTFGSETTFEKCPNGECCKDYNVSFNGDTLRTVYPSTMPPDLCYSGPTGNPSCKFNCEIIDSIEEGPNFYDPEGICLDDCDNIYSGAMIEIIDGSCTFSINYSKRINCDGKNEFYIESIFTEGSCSSYDTSTEVIQKAIREIMKKEVTSSTPDDYIFNINKCFNGEDINGIMTWTTCEYFTCCTFKYSAYKSGSNVVNGGKTDLNVPYDDCSVISCTYICDNNHINITGSYFKQSIIEDNRPFTTFTKVIPNPSFGLSKFVLESPDEGIITLKIYDNLGNEIITKDFEKTEYHSVFELNLDNLSVGSYHYKFELVGQAITNGSFVISK